jgi:hypothetical protein
MRGGDTLELGKVSNCETRRDERLDRKSHLRGASEERTLRQFRLYAMARMGRLRIAINYDQKRKSFPDVKNRQK